MLYLSSVLAVALSVVTFLYNNALSKIAALEASIELERANIKTLEASIEKQNQALKALRIQPKPKDTHAVDTIKIVNSSCAATLEGYKALFKELGK